MTTLRTYKKDSPEYSFYKELHEKQDLNFVKMMKEKYKIPKNKRMSIHKAISLLDNFIDPSDPDLDIENSIHAYQTAERIRKKYPDDKELQITGLIHDLGKVLFSFNEPSYCIVGDTYVVGCQFSDKIIYPETLQKNPDYNKYDKLGIYKENCGLDNLYISYGHDEYLYQVLLQNMDKHKLSKKYLDIIRYHSFYPWHTSGDYKQFMDESDEIKLKDVNDFNEFDLYSKEDDTTITDSVKKYYNYYLDEYFPEELQW